MNATSTTFPDSNTAGNAASRAHQMVDNVADKVTPTVQSTTSAAHQAIDKFADKAAPTVQSATAAAHQAIDKVATAGAKASDWVSTNSKQLADTSVALSDACAGYVRARPLVTVAGALAVGYFAGRLLR